MTEEIKSIEHSPDRRGHAKRGRPFFSIRRRVDPDLDQKIEAEKTRRMEEWLKLEYQWWLVCAIGFVLICGIGLLMAS